jgi:hypothetical protein
MFGERLLLAAEIEKIVENGPRLTKSGKWQYPREVVGLNQKGREGEQVKGASWHGRVFSIGSKSIVRCIF